jgi:hypothetical protein
MKVWIVVKVIEYESENTVHVSSSKELAEAWILEQEKSRYYYYEIDEWLVDEA